MHSENVAIIATAFCALINLLTLGVVIATRRRAHGDGLALSKLDALTAFTIGLSTQDGDPLWLPTAQENSEGYDVRYFDPRGAGASLTLAPGESAQISTGLCMTEAFPRHVALLLIPRSSMGKVHVTLRNSIGLIDRFYIGREIQLLVRNDGDQPWTVQHQDRIAQFLYVLCAHPTHRQTAPVSTEARGRSGFGSSGTR